MMRLKNRFLLPVFFAALSLGLAQAEELKYPEKDPLISITFPDDWEIEKEEGEVLVYSPDEEIELNLWVLSKKECQDLGALEALGEEITEIIEDYVEDFELEKRTRGEINGFQVESLEGSGTSIEEDEDEGEEIDVSVSLLEAEGRLLVLMYWGDEEAEEKHLEALGKITQSIKKP